MTKTNHSIYYLFVFYIYITILDFLPYIFVQLGHYFVYLCFGLFFLIRIFDRTISKKAFLIFCVAILFIIYGVFISIIRDKGVGHVFFTTKMCILFFLLWLIPDISKIPYKRIGRHLYYACLIQAINICLVYFFLCFFGKAPIYIALSSLHCGYDGMGGGYRIVSQYQPFLMVAFFYYLFMRNWKKKYEFIIILLALVATKTLIFYISIAGGLILTFIIKKKSLKKVFPFCVLLGAVLIIIFTLVLTLFSSSPGKAKSILLKQQQIISVTKLSLTDLCFGQGLGTKFYNDDRKTGDTIIEIIPVFWIFTVGILGSLLQWYLFLHICLNVKSRKQYDNFDLVLIISQACFFYTGFSNAYILNGSLAYTLILIYYIKDGFYFEKCKTINYNSCAE